MEGFVHEHRTRIRTYQADRQNVLHNVWYLFLFEEARVEFIRSLGFPIDREVFISHDKFFVAHNSCDYKAPLWYDDPVIIGTRIAAIGTTSITFEHAMVHADTGVLSATARHVLVHVDPHTDQPAPVPEAMRARLTEKR